MNLTQMTVADFDRIKRLLYQRASLLKEATRIDTMLGTYEGSRGTAKARALNSPGSKRPTRKRSAGRRTELKGIILGALKAAGANGIAVKEVAAQLKLKEPNVRVWFYTTAKRVKEIKKIGPSRFAWSD